MLNTANFGLQKPEAAIDNVNIDVINENMDIVDKGLVLYLGTTTGAANTYVIASDDIAALPEGLAVSVKFHIASTAASTLNINGLSAKPIKKAGGANVTNIKVGIYTLRYDGTNFILQGEGASGNAAASDLLLGKTASTDAGEITGTMPNNGPATTETVNLTTEGAEYTIPQGYQSGLRKIKAVITGLIASVIKAGTTVGGILGTFTADATARADHILGSMTAYGNGNKITGTIPGKSAQTYSPSTSAQTITAGQYLSGAQTIAATTGTAIAGDVLSGKTFNSAAGIGLTGNMPNRGAVSQSLPINGSYTIPAGYHNGSGQVTQSVATKAASTYNPSTSAQTIPANQYLTGTQTIAATTGTAAANDVLASKTFNSASGIGQTGTMVNRGAVVITPGTANQAIPAGYHNGSGYVAGDTDLIPPNILAGKEISGVNGAATRSASGTVTSSHYKSTYVGWTTTEDYYSVIVSGLTFIPKRIIVCFFNANGVANIAVAYIENVITPGYGAVKIGGTGLIHTNDYGGASNYAAYVNTGFNLPVNGQDTQYTWYVYEL